MNSPDEERRHRMVREQIAARGLVDQRLLDAFDAVPRHLFVPDELRRHAYQDRALRIGAGQTISQPYMVAFMTNLLALRGNERLLDVGTGSGYQAAILARLAREVHTIEYLRELAESAKQRLTALGIGNVHFHFGDGSLGWPPAAPYDGIIVAAAASTVPAPLLEQLADGGTLVMPLGTSPDDQQLHVWHRSGDEIESRRVFSVAFVPLRGKYGRGN